MSADQYIKLKHNALRGRLPEWWGNTPPDWWKPKPAPPNPELQPTEKSEVGDR